jgi:arginyl-tRNA synthetase
MQVLRQVHAEAGRYGTFDEGGGRTVVVEYSSPNIAKPFHAGHLRSTIIGNFVANVSEAAGFRPVRVNYLGDWGKQYGASSQCQHGPV